jgi:hypothetical protein
MKTLLAYSIGMELGWELCTWIPAIRNKSLEYEETVVICKPGFDYLYQDFANIIYHYDKKIKGVGYYGWNPKKAVKLPKKFKLLYPKAHVLIPNERICTKWERIYVKYGEYNEKLHSDVMIHARSEVKFGRKNRNWPVRKYEKLIRMLRSNRELSISSIGSIDGAHWVPGTLDLRGCSLEMLCNRMASSTVVIGVSAGPMHLASLCGTPHVVWTDRHYQKAIKGTNRNRYEELWNPFLTKVEVIDSEGWNPKAKTVYEVVK